MGTVRFLLALCVVVTHYPGSKLFGLNLLSAITAVQAFYVISGFLITMVLNERADYASVGKFYLSRYLRLWPTYVVVACLQLYFFLWPYFVARLGVNPVSAAYLIFTNATLIGQDWALFLRFDEAGGLAPTAAFTTYPKPWVADWLIVTQAWTLGIELSFYLIAPVFCRRLSTTLLLFSFGLGVRIAIGLWHPESGDAWFYRFFPAELMLFGAGGLAYHAGKALHDRMGTSTLRVAGGAVVVAMSGLIVFDSFVPTMVPRNSMAIFLINPVFLLCTVLACPLMFYAARRSRVDAFIGELSYPMYICHIFVGTMMFHFLRYYPPSGVYVLVVIVVSVALFFFIALPVDHLRKHFGARVPQLTAAHH